MVDESVNRGGMINVSVSDVSVKGGCVSVSVWKVRMQRLVEYDRWGGGV